jgi:hypothetical protein
MAEAYWMFDGHPRKFREILSRRKKKKGERTERHTGSKQQQTLQRSCYRPTINCP